MHAKIRLHSVEILFFPDFFDISVIFSCKFPVLLTNFYYICIAMRIKIRAYYFLFNPKRLSDMRHFYKTTSLKVCAILLSLAWMDEAAAQVMISYDGNSGKDMVASLRVTEAEDDERDVMVYDFIYNEDRSLKTLKYMGQYYEDWDFEAEELQIDYTWGIGTLGVSMTYQGMSGFTFSFPMNASHCVTEDRSDGDFDEAYTFTYNADGYVTSLTEWTTPGVLTWTNGNLMEFQCGNYRRTFMYTEHGNNLNMDLGLHGFAVEGFFCLPLGKWSAKFPESIKEYIDGKLSYEGKLTYSFDDKGRVAKIELEAKEYEDSGIDAYTSTMEISYDKSFDTSIQGVELQQQEKSAKYYDMSGRRQAGMKRGLNIVKGKDGHTRKIMMKK